MANNKREPVPGGHAAIEAIDLTKRYGEHTTVRGVSFQVQRGEVLGILGPNGAGKSTTVEMLTGARLPSGGTARVLGENPARGASRWRARVGVVTQTSADIERATSREVLQHFAGLYPSPRSTEDVLSACGLALHADKRIRRLSGGQRRRLDVALGIIGDPEVLFLDEPTTGFDPEARQEFWGLINQLRAEGTAILLTTHDLEEAERLSDRIGIIVAGRLAALSAADELGGPRARAPRVLWRERGEQRESIVDEPGMFTAALVEHLGDEPEDLRIHRPSLQDIYLDLLAAEEHNGSEPPETRPEKGQRS